MPRKKGMKLDQALKLYIALYCLCFGLTWLISVPMLNHVTPKSECLLFVSPTVEYGPSAGIKNHTLSSCKKIILKWAPAIYKK